MYTPQPPAKVEATPLSCPPPPQKTLRDRIVYWNTIMLDANALDHTPVQPGEKRVYGEQIGPHRTTRAFAIVQIAIFDAVNAIVGGYCGYAFNQQRPNGSAAAILVRRAYDGSQYPEPIIGLGYIPSDEPGKWRPDPISQIPLALGGYWYLVEPFVISSADYFRSTPPPALASAKYTAAFKEVKRLGGDGVTTPTERTEDQTLAGIYWGYDGTPGLGTPPRLYNQIAVHLALQKKSDGAKLARLLALVNTAMADAVLSAWETKYYYEFWRPITGIREAAGDGNPATIGDPDWTPLGAQASNISGPNFTPPFPAYTSGHATLGCAMFTTVRKFYKTDNIAFTFVSDELNGVTRDNLGNVRPYAPRSFSSLSEAIQENGQSRIYLGIHWSFDKTKGIAMGQSVANYCFEHTFRPR